MARISDNVRLGAPLGVPLGVQRMVLALVGIFFVYGLVTKNVIQAVWFPLLYLSIYLHELGHALSARAFGGQVLGISIHLVGGVTMTRGLGAPWSRIAMTAAGPAVNLLIGFGIRYLVHPDPFAGEVYAVLYGLMFANLLWGFFNVLPIYPLDGGQILQTVLEMRLPAERATAISAVVSFVAIGATAVVSLAGAGLLGLEGLGSGMLFLILAFFGWENAQRWRAAHAAGASVSRLASMIGRGARNGDGPGRNPSPRSRPTERRSLRDLSEDVELMRKLLRRGARVGFGGLSPEDRRLVLFHRTLLEAELNREGFDGLSEEQRELLALHHDLDDRSLSH